MVLILLDDLGYGDLGSYGGTFIRTPQLDAFAAEGLRFTRFYAGAPSCTPSRAALLTGLHPSALGFRFPFAGGDRRVLPEAVPTLPEVLAGAGYTSAHIGKWHLGRRRLPDAAGFDRAVTSAPNRYRDPTLRSDGKRHTHRGHLTEILTDLAIAFLDEHRRERFFLNLWYAAPHHPHQPPEAWAHRYPATPAGRYAALVSAVDEQIGRVLEALRRLGLEQRTLVIVTSDNGGGRKGLPTNGALRGYKHDLFEGGIRVPLLARWTGTVPAGRTTDALALGVDWLPTLAELAGVERPARLDGRSLADVLRGGTPAPRDETLFWETRPEAPVAARETDWAARRGPWKLVRQHAVAGGAPQLFDLDRDGGERADRASAKPRIAAELRDAYRAWRVRETQLPWTIERIEGAVTREAEQLRFAGGWVALAPDSRFDVDHGDLSFRVRVDAGTLGSEQRLAEQPGSWALGLDPDGRVRLRLEGSEQGPAVELASDAKLVPGAASQVAFSIYGRQKSTSLVRLHVAGSGAVDAVGPAGVAPPHGPVRLGGDADGGRRFRGTLEAPTFFLAALSEEDLVAAGP